MHWCILIWPNKMHSFKVLWLTIAQWVQLLRSTLVPAGTVAGIMSPAQLWMQSTTSTLKFHLLQTPQLRTCTVLRHKTENSSFKERKHPTPVLIIPENNLKIKHLQTSQLPWHQLSLQGPLSNHDQRLGRRGGRGNHREVVEGESRQSRSQEREGTDHQRKHQPRLQFRIHGLQALKQLIHHTTHHQCVYINSRLFLLEIIVYFNLVAWRNVQSVQLTLNSPHRH